MPKTFIKKDDKYQRIYCDGVRCVLVGNGRSFKLIGFIEDPQFPEEEDSEQNANRFNPNSHHTLLFELTLPPRAMLDLKYSLDYLINQMKNQNNNQTEE
jgi:hypothetical protein